MHFTSVAILVYAAPGEGAVPGTPGSREDPVPGLLPHVFFDLRPVTDMHLILLVQKINCVISMFVNLKNK